MESWRHVKGKLTCHEVSTLERILKKKIIIIVITGSNIVTIAKSRQFTTLLSLFTGKLLKHSSNFLNSLGSIRQTAKIAYSTSLGILCLHSYHRKLALVQ